jgi:hypothetical protein
MTTDARRAGGQHPEGCMCDGCNPSFHPEACLCGGFCRRDAGLVDRSSFACGGNIVLVPESHREGLRVTCVIHDEVVLEKTWDNVKETIREMQRHGITLDADKLEDLN